MTDIHGTVHWSELMTRDVKGALAYYGEVCGWTFDEMEMPEGGTYYVGMAHGKPAGGIMDMTPLEHLKDVPAHWFTYIAINDVQDGVNTTEDKGGEILRAPFDVPGIGKIAIVKDPGGAALGIMTPATDG
ncbi:MULTISPECIES: VOC family protein [Halocynthiibacter]|uniref:VOC family protein n=1 Tax=Halocynthiibacter halioticoli TaxID=2986804 RepID=A0AAE3J288_9RHOB|nr:MULTISPECIES: VOC family protein [Halocynthiibacter]MCV6825336.1 VOC family protein [Halocynthiibacter halioticoli]MCW4058337.1 VOC family protein [Halocynthiibacter sp. SDUM655004]MDE0588642.1 VOC family protein [Halocynthiibacter sp. C4]